MISGGWKGAKITTPRNAGAGQRKLRNTLPLVSGSSATSTHHLPSQPTNTPRQLSTRGPQAHLQPLTLLARGTLKLFRPRHYFPDDTTASTDRHGFDASACPHCASLTTSNFCPSNVPVSTILSLAHSTPSSFYNSTCQLKEPI